MKKKRDFSGHTGGRVDDGHCLLGEICADMEIEDWPAVAHGW